MYLSSWIFAMAITFVCGRLWSNVKSRGTYLTNHFFIPNSSFKMWYNYSDDIPTASAISRTFSRRYSMAILCTFAINSGIVARFGRPLGGSSSKLSWPNLNWLVHLATVEYERAESPSEFWKLARISFSYLF